MYVISATHSRLGRSAVKLRSTRSGAWRAPSRTVVMVLLRRLTPTKPAFRISRATRLRPTRMPASARSICRRGAPYVPFEANVCRMDFGDQRGIGHGPHRGRTLHPCVIAAGGDIQDAAHHSNGVTGPVLAHELEPFGGITSVSRANQAAAFERMSRSNLSWRFSRRRRLSSSRSTVVRRRGTTTLFAALEVTTRRIIAARYGGDASSFSAL